MRKSHVVRGVIDDVVLMFCLSLTADMVHATSDSYSTHARANANFDILKNVLMHSPNANVKKAVQTVRKNKYNTNAIIYRDSVNMIRDVAKQERVTCSKSVEQFLDMQRLNAKAFAAFLEQLGALPRVIRAMEKRSRSCKK